MKTTQEELLKELQKGYPNKTKEKLMTFINGEITSDETHRIEKYVGENLKGKHYLATNVFQIHNNIDTLNIILKHNNIDEINEWLNEVVQDYTYKGRAIYNLVEVNLEKRIFTISLYNENDEDFVGEEYELDDDELQGEHIALSYDELVEIIKK